MFLQLVNTVKGFSQIDSNLLLKNGNGDILSLLLIGFEVRSVSYRPSFLCSDLWPKCEARGS